MEQIGIIGAVREMTGYLERIATSLEAIERHMAPPPPSDAGVVNLAAWLASTCEPANDGTVEAD